MDQRCSLPSYEDLLPSPFQSPPGLPDSSIDVSPFACLERHHVKDALNRVRLGRIWLDAEVAQFQPICIESGKALREG